MSYLNRNRLKNFFINLKKYFKSEEFLNSMAISNAEIDNIANTAGYNDNGTGTVNYDFVPRSGGAVLTGDHLGKTTNNSNLMFSGGTGWDYGACVSMYGKDNAVNAGVCLIRAYDATNDTILSIQPSGTINKVTNGTTKSFAMQEDYVPRSGGAVLSGGEFYRTDTSNMLTLGGGDTRIHGGDILLFGTSSSYAPGAVCLIASVGDGQEYYTYLYPNGTWTWNGQPIQYGSDARLKQQIAEIDDKLLDAWEDVNLVQFKYNDAVDQKGKDKARLHTGYVVQQIDSACKSHNVDISAYGLYCHEEYPEETEEVEVEQADGTKVKERKVIREANEHYSLRYTEVYAIECAYLRKRVKELEERLEKLEGNSK